MECSFCMADGAPWGEPNEALNHTESALEEAGGEMVISTGAPGKTCPAPLE